MPMITAPWLSAYKPTMAAVLRCCGNPSKIVTQRATHAHERAAHQTQADPVKKVSRDGSHDRGFGYMELFERLEQKLGLCLYH